MAKSEFNSIFEEILQKVGNNGKFQRRFNILFNFIFIMFVCMANSSLYIIMFVPEHWCYVPGREHTNFTLEEWKQFTIIR